MRRERTGEEPRLTEAEQDIVRQCRFEARYSGDLSERFWKAVNHKANDRTLYVFACALQDLEARVLGLVNESVEIQARKFIAAQRASRVKRRVTTRRRKGK